MRVFLGQWVQADIRINRRDERGSYGQTSQPLARSYELSANTPASARLRWVEPMYTAQEFEAV